MFSSGHDAALVSALKTSPKVSAVDHVTYHNGHLFVAGQTKKSRKLVEDVAVHNWTDLIA